METTQIPVAEITSAKQMLNILSSIPADKFVTGEFEDDNGNSCFIGHINKALGVDADYSWDGFGARPLTAKYLKVKHNLDKSGVDVNNWPGVNGYTEPVIKDRVIHLLNDMIQDGY